MEMIWKQQTLQICSRANSHKTTYRLNIEKNSVLWTIGPNGAGKSTTSK